MSTRRIPVPVLAAAVAASAAMVPPAAADQIDSVWAPAASGNWSVPENWAPFGVPSNDGVDFYNVRIDDDPAFVVVAFNLPAAAINALTIDGGDRLRIINARNLTIVGGPIRNSGVLELFSNNDFSTRLRIDGDVTLEGTGGVEGVGNTANVITTTIPGSRLTNLTNPITGVMRIGNDELSFTTHALVEANVDGRDIILDPPPDGDITNAFMMRASGGGTLRLGAGRYENASGTFAALDGSQVRLFDGVTINGGSLVAEPGGEILVVGVVDVSDVASHGQLTIQNNRRLTVHGPLVNTGDIDVQASNAFPGRMRIDGPVTLTGGGTLSLTGANVSSSVIDAVAEGDRLTNVDNTIGGRGLIGVDGMSLTNHALVEANRDGLTLTLDPPAGGDVTNTGTLRATAGGTLRLENGLYDNTGGLIEAEDGSTIDLRAGAIVSGGTLRTVDTGLVVVTASSARLAEVAHEANTVIQNNRQLIVEGLLLNTGDIDVQAISDFPGRLTVDGPVSLTGGGTIALTGANVSSSVIDAVTEGDRLTNEDNTITGRGRIGVDGMSLTNHALVAANRDGLALTLDPPAGGDVTNTGTLRATAGGTLRLGSGVYENTGGVIEAEADSTVDVRTGVIISGGTLRSVESGEVIVDAAPARFVGVVHDARTSVPNNRQLIVEGDFSSTGTVALSSIDVFATRLSIDGDLTLTGGGTVSMTSDIANTNTCRIDALTPGDRLTIEDGTIEGNGTIGADVMSTTNHGRIDANHPALPMTIDPPAEGDFTNLGLLVASGPADLRIGEGPMDNAGTVSIATGARLRRLAGDYTQTAGVTRVEGELQVDAGVVDLRGGTLAGSGLVDADFRVGVATVAPGLSPGRLDVDGAYRPTLDGTLAIEIGGLVAEAEHDVLAVTGSAELDGTVCLVLIDDFVPAIGDTFEIMTAATVSGVFPCVKTPVLPDGGFVITYETDRVLATVTFDAPDPADLDGSGLVDFGDLLILLASWGPCPNTCCVADLDGNGVVEFDDVLRLLIAWTPA